MCWEGLLSVWPTKAVFDLRPMSANAITLRVDGFCDWSSIGSDMVVSLNVKNSLLLYSRKLTEWIAHMDIMLCMLWLFGMIYMRNKRTWCEEEQSIYTGFDGGIFSIIHSNYSLWRRNARMSFHICFYQYIASSMKFALWWSRHFDEPFSAFICSFNLTSS